MSRTVTVYVTGAKAPVKIETKDDNPHIAVHLDEEGVMGLLSGGRPNLVIGHWVEDQWIDLAETEFPDADFQPPEPPDDRVLRDEEAQE